MPNVWPDSQRSYGPRQLQSASVAGAPMVPLLAGLWRLPLICIRVRPRHLGRGSMLPLLGHNGLLASGKELGNGDENCFRHFS